MEIATRSPYAGSGAFNTYFHALDEITAALPSVKHIKPDDEQPWVLLSPWIDLVLSSQHADHFLRIRLPGLYCDALTDTGKIWATTQKIREHTMRGLEEGFPSRTTDGTLLSEVFSQQRPSRAYFVRLNTCSLKNTESLVSASLFCEDSDSEVRIGNRAVTEAKEIWQRTVTSARGCDGIRCLRNTQKDVFAFLF